MKKRIEKKINELESKLFDIYDISCERDLSGYELANYKEQIKKILAQIEILEEIKNG